MNNEQQTWILKPGVTFTQAKESDWLHMYPHQLASMRADIPRSIFEQCFVELDVSGLTRQVEDEIDYVMEKAIMNHITSEAIDADGSEMHESIKDQAVKAIVLLLLNQEGEKE